MKKTRIAYGVGAFALIAVLGLLIAKTRSVDFEGHNDIVAYSYGGQVHMWFDGCYAEADNYVPNRLSVLRGRMPVTRRLPYQWYDTPNIRVGTHADFAVLAHKNALRVLDAFGLQDGREIRFLPNLMAGTAVFKFERG